MKNQEFKNKIATLSMMLITAFVSFKVHGREDG